MEKYVVTISRQFASMGRTIAQQMSTTLGIKFYDRDIVDETAKRTGQTVSEVSSIEEQGASPFSNHRYPLDLGLLSLHKQIFEVQSNIIRDLASKESCIIVGRCADSVLKDFPRCLNIYVYAPREERLKNCVERLSMDPKKAKDTLTFMDRARELYRARFAGTKNAMEHQHLMIDSSHFGPEATAQILCTVVRQVFDA
ncbi:MAG: cytidylate kinase-like family protein [Oscillospiraceae bacterium]|nr:cytidylate kinase-like family protein [Oscillospiraceae bacterium]